MPRVAPGGVALFHDTNIIGWPGYAWDRDVPPVQAALDDWCAGDGTLVGEPAGRIRHGHHPAVKTCRRHPGCARNLGHDGPCMGRRGNLVPAYEPVRVIEVTSRDADGIPDGFREYFLGAPEAGRTA